MKTRTQFLIQGPIEQKALLLAHGAGAGMEHPWMQHLADYLAASGVGTIRFDFPYMQKRKKNGTKAPPDRKDALLEHFLVQWDFWSERLEFLCIGGKSMGGRMALNLALEHPVGSVVVFSYPLISSAAGETQPGHERLKPLQEIMVPSLIVQGAKDPMGDADHFPDEISPNLSVVWCQEANHDLLAPRRSGVDNNLQWQLFSDLVSQWLD